jgi:sn-glycerol 3-phosphate transport system substrate-binding protein
MMKVTETPGTAAAAPAALRIVTQRLSDRKWVTGARPKGTIGLARVRAILQEELEEVWANRKPAKEALDAAVLRGNVELRPAPKDVRSK